MAARKSSGRPGGPVHAGLYARISLARFGETVKVDEQLDDCAKVARQRGWQIIDRYSDPNKSAWRRNRRRPDWERMLADVEGGRINAIIVYHGDRLVRQPWDLELLLRLADDKGIRLASPTGERDLDNPDDRFILRIEAAQACRESDNTSRRLKRHFNKAAEKGIVRLGGRGGRAYGYEPDGLTVREEDKQWLIEVADRIIAGETVGAIARDITARGARTTTGKEWDYGDLRRVMQRPRLAGLVSHNGEIVGPSAWPAILDRDKWETVNALLDKKAADFSHISNARRYLLSGIAVCGTCGGPLRIRQNSLKRCLQGYGCVNRACSHKVYRSKEYLDEYIIGQVITACRNRKFRPDNAGNAGADLASRLRELEATRKRRIEEFADDADADPEIIRVTVRRLNDQIAEVKAAKAQAAQPHALEGTDDLTRAEWDRLSLDRQRAIVRATVDITVFPSRRGPGFDKSTVRVEGK